MWVAARWRMRRFLAALALVLVTGAMAHGLTLESPRIQATLMLTSSKDPFRIRGRLAGVDLATVVDGPVTVRFGDQWARVSAGQFRRRGNSVFTWKSYLYGVKKVTINTKKATIDVVGGGVELGELPGPVTLAIGTSAGAVCGEAVWEPVAPGKSKRKTRKLAFALAPCDDLGFRVALRARLERVRVIPPIMVPPPPSLRLHRTPRIDRSLRRVAIQPPVRPHLHLVALQQTQVNETTDQVRIDPVAAQVLRVGTHVLGVGVGDAQDAHRHRRLLGDRLGHGASETAADRVLLDGQDQPGLAGRLAEERAVDRLDRMEVDDARIFEVKALDAMLQNVEHGFPHAVGGRPQALMLGSGERAPAKPAANHAHQASSPRSGFGFKLRVGRRTFVGRAFRGALTLFD